MDKEYYTNKLVLHDHLATNTYNKVHIEADKKVHKNMLKLVKNHAECLTNKEFKYLTSTEWKSSSFYLNPKIHKSKEIAERYRTQRYT